jgi:hypothetical protein
MINKLDKDDTLFIVLSVITPLVLWWFTHGKAKYDTKGMR